MFKRILVLAVGLLMVPACFKAPHDAEYDRQNPNKVFIAGTTRNAVGIPVGKALVYLDTDLWDTTDLAGGFQADSVDPGIYTLKIERPIPLYDTILLEGACSLWAGRVIEDTTFFFRRAVWDMENEPGPMPAHWAPDTCGWKIVPDRDRPDNQVLAMRPHPFAFTDQGRALCQDVFKDFVYEVAVKPLFTNQSGWQAGVVWCYQNRSNYYRFRISETDLVCNYVTSSGSDTFFIRTPGRPRGAWYKIRIERAGSITRVFLDGSQIGRDIDKNPLADGKIGLWVQAETPLDSIAFQYDNIWIEPTK